MERNALCPRDPEPREGLVRLLDEAEALKREEMAPLPELPGPAPTAPSGASPAGGASPSETVDAPLTSASASLAELRSASTKELRARARGAGATAEQMERADESDEPRAALLALMRALPSWDGCAAPEGEGEQGVEQAAALGGLTEVPSDELRLEQPWAVASSSGSHVCFL
jgi:hypothetical protein